MKHELNFFHTVKGEQVRIIAHMDGLLPIGNNGYRIQIWPAIQHEQQEIIARFTIDLNGQLYKLGDEKNDSYCTDNSLSEVIIREGMYDRYKYNIVKGEQDPFTDNILFEENLETHKNGQTVHFNDKSYTVVGHYFRNEADSFYTVNLEQQL